MIVLIVDDNATDRAQLRHAMETHAGPDFQCIELASLADLDGASVRGLVRLAGAPQAVQPGELEAAAAFPIENPNPVLRVARDGTVQFANRASGPLLASWGTTVGGQVPAEWRRYIQDVLVTGESQDRELACGEHVLELGLAPISAAGYVNVYGRDITERTHARTAQEAHLAHLKRLLQVSEQVLAETTLEGLLQSLVDAACELTGARYGTAGHSFRDGAFQVGANSHSPGAPPCPPGQVFQMERGGVYLELVRRQTTLRLTDAALRADPAWWGLPEAHVPLRGLLGASWLGCDGNVEGLIMVTDKSTGEFTAEDEAVLAQLTGLAALGLHHIEAHQEARREAALAAQRATELAAASAALQEERDLLDGLMEHTRTSLVYLDTRFNFLRMNAAYELACQRPRSEMLGRNHFDLFPNAENEAIFRQVAETGEPVEYIAKPFEFADMPWRGVTYWDWTLTPLKKADGSVQGLIFSLVDVTERIRAQEALRQGQADLDQRVQERTAELAGANERLAHQAAVLSEQAELLELTHDAILVLGLDGTIRFWNRGAEERYGWGRSEAVGQRSHTLLQTQFPQPQEQAYAHLLAHGRWEGELEQTRRDGTKVMVASRWALQQAAEGRPAWILEINDDITERKRAEEELRRASSYARRLIEASLDPLVTISPEGKITDVNRATEDVTGVPRQHLIGTDFSDYFIQPEQARAGYQQVLAEGFVRDYPLTIRHLAGGTTDVLYNATVYRDESGAVVGVFAAARDITERKRAEEELRKASSYARSLIEASLDPLVTISPGGKITDVNQATETVTGVPRQRLIGTDFSDYFTEPAKARQGYQQVLAQGLVRDYPLTIRHASGRTTNVHYNATTYRDESGQVQGVFAAARDHTEHERAEAALRKASQYARNLIEASLDPLVTISPEGKITDVNRATESVTGLLRERLIGTDFSDYFTEPDKARQGYQQVLAQGLVRDYPLTIRHAEGWTTDVLYNATVYRNEAGSVEGVFAAARDITERKRAEQEHAQRIREQAARAEAEAGRARLAFLAEASKLLSSSLDYKATVASLVRLAVPRLADWCTIDMVGDDGSLQVLEVAHADPDKVKWGWEMRRRYPIDLDAATGVAQVLRSGRSELYPEFPLAELKAAARTPEERALVAAVGYRSAMLVPVQARERVLGVITLISSESGRHFTPDDLALAEELAQRAGMAVDNARLYEAAQRELAERERVQAEILRRERELSVLYTINRAAIQSLSVEERLHDSLQATLAALDVEAGAVYLMEPDQQMLVLRVHLGQPEDVLRHSVPLKLGEGLAGRAAAERQPLALDVDNYVRQPLAGILQRAGFRTLASTPLLSAGQVVGAMTLQTHRTDAFPESELALLGVIGQHLGSYVSNAQLYETLQQRTGQLEAANRELEAFSYSVSHDLRAPLRTIDGFSRILLEECAAELSPDAQQYLQLVHEGSLRMSQLIDGLLALSRLGRQALALQTVAPASLVAEALKDLSADQEGRHVEIVVGDLPPCQADPRLLKQVFANLLSNALKFTRRRDPARIEVGCQEEKGEAAYYVKDNGVGFDMQYAGKLFGVFQRLHRAEDYEGMGAGLAIVQRIIYRHGGRVWAEAEIDKGAVFYFTVGGLHE